MIRKHATCATVIFTLLAAVPVFAQSDTPWDTKGNALLKGTYNFRHVVWIVGDNAGNLRRSVSLSGTLDFDGDGKYTLKSTVFDSNAGVEQTLNKDGAYAIAASGFGFLTSPTLDNGRVFGLVSQGIFVASSTEDGINDLFLAAPARAEAPTTSSFSGRYKVVEFNFPSLTAGLARDALFEVNPDGSGNLGAINATGYVGGSGRTVSQTISGPRYSFDNGNGTLAFGGALTNQNLLAGDRRIFLTEDGNFFFGGSLNSANMLVGVKALSEPAKLDGLFYQAGADIDQSGLADGKSTIHTYYGSVQSSAGVQINHQRLLSGFDEDAYDYSYSDPFTVNDQGLYEDFLGFQNILGAGGVIRISFGTGTTPGLGIAVKAPTLTGPDVFLNPTSVINGASLTPFTVGISPGEYISLSGTGLAAEAAEDSSFPPTLGGVQVLINNTPAPLRQVSPEKIIALVPFATQGPIAKVVVIKNGVESNPVTAFVNTTSAGAFTVPPGGTGFADAIHSDGTAINSQNPARLGETISVFVTGLGQVDPAVPDATSGPTSPMSKAVASTGAFVDGSPATIDFAGLAPGVIGRYRMDITIPSSLAPGDLYLDISGPDSYSSQVQIPVSRRTDQELDGLQRTRPGEEIRSHRPRGRPQFPASRSKTPKRKP